MMKDRIPGVPAVILAVVLILALAALLACGGGEPTERAAPTAGGSQSTERPTPTTVTAQNTPAPTIPSRNNGAPETATQVPGQTPTPAPTATPVLTTIPSPTATPVPTTIPSPTATPVPATTPVPAATPTPTATPAPTPIPDPSPAVAWEGAAALLPSGLNEVEVWDWETAMSSGAVDSGLPSSMEEEFGWLLEDPANSGISLEDVRSFALASVETEQGPYMELNVLEGDFDLAKAEEYLDNIFAQYTGSDDPSDFRENYKGYEIYEGQAAALTLLDDKDAIAFGDPPEAVKLLVDAVASRSGLLLHGNEYRLTRYADYTGVDFDEYVGMTLNRLGGSFYANVRGGASAYFDGCCWASGYSVSGGGGELEVTIVYPFREEGQAERQVEDVRLHIEGDLPDETMLEDVEADGLFVVGTATGAADVWLEAIEYYWRP